MFHLASKGSMQFDHYHFLFVCFFLCVEFVYYQAFTYNCITPVLLPVTGTAHTAFLAFSFLLTDVLGHISACIKICNVMFENLVSGLTRGNRCLLLVTQDN